jgi:cell wall-associated NlpC family hydrolase
VASTRNAARLRAVIIGIVAAGSAAFLIPAIAAAVPRDPATDTIASVTERLDNLSKQSESLAEKYNGAQITLTARQKAAGKAQSAFRSAAATYQTARAQLTNTLKSQYEGAQFSTAGALLTSTNEANYLDKVEALNLLNAHRSAVVAELITARANADKAQEAAADALQKAKSVRDLVSKQRADVEAQTKKYTDLLATLNAQQQEQYRDRNAPTAAQLATTQTTQAPQALTAPAQPAAPPAVGGGSAKAQIAVAYARAQLGKPYVFAAAGPDAFDCSGLTMMAWAAAGVSLPHYAPSQMQYGSTVPIDVSAMLPGDLIFLYPDIGHVEIYAGNGMAISAPQPGDVVKYVSVAYDMPNIVGVRRIA